MFSSKILHRSSIAEADGRASFLKTGHRLLMKATTIVDSSNCHPALHLELARLFQRVDRCELIKFLQFRLSENVFVLGSTMLQSGLRGDKRLWRLRMGALVSSGLGAASPSLAQGLRTSGAHWRP